MKRIAGDVLKEYFKSQQGSDASDIIRSTTELGVSTLDIQKLLQVKNDLLAEIGALSDQIQGLKQELVAIADDIARFTFGERTGQKAEDFVKNELPNLDPQEAAERLAELKEEAGEELYDDGVIPFADTHVGEWYTTYAKQARELGLVEGTGESNGTKLDPARDTNVAETIMMFARLDGIDEKAIPVSDIGAALPEWAQSAAGTLEGAGVDLDAIFGGKGASETATRGEVAILLDQVLDLQDSDPKLTEKFSDIDDATEAEHKAIADVYDAGIMTGYGDSDEFGVHDPLNRAALVKILNLSHEEFGIETSATARTRVQQGSVRSVEETNVQTETGGRRFEGPRPSNRLR